MRKYDLSYACYQSKKKYSSREIFRRATLKRRIGIGLATLVLGAASVGLAIHGAKQRSDDNPANLNLPPTNILPDNPLQIKPPQNGYDYLRRSLFTKFRNVHNI